MASLTARVQYLNDIDPFSASTNFPEPARPPHYTFNVNIPLINQIAGIHRILKAPHKLDDCTLQLFRYSGSEGDYGSYLDLESTIDEQAEDFEDFHSNRKNTIILRTQLSVRVHSIIEKLLSCTGRELRRALFSLKQIFQDDKDLVHEFVQNDGLACLIKVGSEADQNYQNYILRALGQVMLYVDGMNGVIEHIETIQWLYSLIASKYRLVVKTTLKLLLVFVEYSESNSQLLINTVCLVDSHRGSTPWSNIMNLLKEKDSADMELLVYAVTLINKTLNSIPDQDTYYDMVDSLEEQGMEHVIQYYMSKQGTDLDLLQQLHIYEAVLKHEDGVPDTKPLPLDARFRRSRTSVSDENERRKSRRHSLGTVNGTPVNNNNHSLNFHSRSLENTPEESPYWQDRNQNIIETKTNHHQLNGHVNGVNGNGHIETNGHGVTPSLRRRRERDARNKSLIKQQEENGKTFHRSDSLSSSSSDNNSTLLNDKTTYPSRLDNVDTNRQKEESIPHYGNNKKAWMLSMMYAKSQEEDNNKNLSDPVSPVISPISINNNQVTYSPSKIPVKEPPQCDVPSGIVGRAKDGLASGGTGAISPPPKQPFDPDVKWDQLVKAVRRPLLINGLDFTDLRSDEDDDVLEYLGPPENCSEGPPPPPLPPGLGPPPPPPPNGPPPAPPSWMKRNNQDKANKPVHPNKTKKTVKLFWREVREDRGKKQKGSSIWDDLTPVHLDTQKLEHLFQNRAKEVPTKEKGPESTSKKSEVIVLDTKRSNAINIAMTKLPPPRTIKTAVLKMDSTIVNREGIEKVLGMLPTEDEKSRISEAQLSNPDTPLGSAEQFLLTLASISELEARLRLWAFRLDYDSLEREVAEPLMDLKQAMKEIEGSETLRVILSTLRSVGNFLNGVEIKGFHIEYLSKVPEVKDTVQKHSLLHHLCHIVMERFPNSSDLYSELGSVTRASKIDYCEVSKALNKMESECKASWDYLKAILKHDCNITLKVRTTEFLTDCAERIIVLKVIHRRMLNRYHKFLLYLGCGPSEQELSVQRCCRILSEFALEYRTTRERVLQQIEKKANHRQRNKTRGKMITDMERFKTKEQLADQELRQLLNGSGEGQKWGTVPTTRGRVRSQLSGGSLGRHSTPPVAKDEGGVDEDAILESLVKTATAQPHKSEPRIRKKARYGDRKSLRRTLKGGLELSEEERNLLTTMTT